MSAGAAAREAGTTGSTVGVAATSGVIATVRRGLQLSPQIREGLWLTLGLAMLATAGRVVVPIAVQQTVDAGLTGQRPDVGSVVLLLSLAAAGIVVTGLSSYATSLRLFRATEAGLAHVRVGAFRRVHDLSVLTQSSERRGALVSRVTSDVDTVSTFLQFGGLLLFLSMGQIIVASVVMAVYSIEMTVVVMLTCLPLLVLAPRMQKRISGAYAAVRERVGDMLGAISETVVGADTIRAYAVEDRTAVRVDAAVAEHRDAMARAQTLVSFSFSSGVLVSGLSVSTVALAGLVLGASGDLTLGELLGFLFLVQLFTAPLMIMTEMLNELQNAVAGWRRVMAVLDTPADVADPGEGGVLLPRGPVVARFEDVSFAYPGQDAGTSGPLVLRDVDLEVPARTRVAVVGETGSGKTTMAKLLTRLMDPTGGRVLLDGVDLRDVRFSSLRDRVGMVPQEGFLFDTTLLENVRYGTPDADRAAVELALTELGLADWVEGLPHGLDTAVGQRGESMSAGERQLVALARAYLADPDLLVLDEATSAVDPATEVRLQRALDGLTRGRTSVTIAHRLSTAEVADLVVVVDAGRVVETGRHAGLVDAGGVYSRLHASWVAQRSVGGAAPRGNGSADHASRREEPW